LNISVGAGCPNPLPALTIAILMLHFLHSEGELSSLASSEGARLEKGEDGRIHLRGPKESEIIGRDPSHSCHVTE